MFFFLCDRSRKNIPYQVKEMNIKLCPIMTVLSAEVFNLTSLQCSETAPLKAPCFLMLKMCFAFFKLDNSENFLLSEELE